LGVQQAILNARPVISQNEGALASARRNEGLSPPGWAGIPRGSYHAACLAYAEEMFRWVWGVINYVTSQTDAWDEPLTEVSPVYLSPEAFKPGSIDWWWWYREEIARCFRERFVPLDPEGLLAGARNEALAAAAAAESKAPQATRRRRHSPEAEQTMEWSPPMNVGEVAKIFKVGRRAMGRMLAGGKVKCQKINRQMYRVDMSELPTGQQDRFRKRG
jgi:hypothetical protein